jgi:hypothetical protein
MYYFVVIVSTGRIFDIQWWYFILYNNRAVNEQMIIFEEAPIRPIIRIRMLVMVRDFQKT